MKTELALYHLILDVIRTLTAQCDNKSNDFLMQLRKSLHIELERKIYKITWIYNNFHYGPFEVDARGFDFYIRADTSAALKKLNSDKLYKEDNGKFAQQLILKLGEKSGINIDCSEYADDSKSINAGFQKAEYLQNIFLVIFSATTVWWLTDVKQATFSALVVLGLLAVLDRLPDIAVLKKVRFYERFIVSAAVCISVNMTFSVEILLIQLLPVFILNILEKKRAQSGFWFLPGALLILSFSFELSQQLTMVVAFFLVIFIWSIISKSRLPNKALVFLFVGSIVGSILLFILDFEKSTSTSVASESVFYVWLYFLLAAVFFFNVLLVWVNGVQTSLIPWSMSFYVLCNVAINATMIAPDYMMVGTIGLGLVVLIKVVNSVFSFCDGNLDQVRS